MLFDLQKTLPQPVIIFLIVCRGYHRKLGTAYSILTLGTATDLSLAEVKRFLLFSLIRHATLTIQLSLHGSFGFHNPIQRNLQLNHLHIVSDIFCNSRRGNLAILFVTSLKIISFQVLIWQLLFCIPH
jgi:hypothetical protein